MTLPRHVRWVKRCPPRLRPILRNLIIVGASLLALARLQNLHHWRGKLRRLYLITFRKGYVQAQLARRQGTCNQCGACCRLAVTCPFLHDNLCTIYGDCQPQVCHLFPIDPRDLADVGEQCSYRFDVVTSFDAPAGGEAPR
ncbi:MAG: hypothetical protein KatS3mg131_0499 [Candidatus Tectimicrobiota bacterium]|nr:MAG: hypothetical protein KatS3mg131_0499 [Candidatus Tectomicrobia bacterium]